MSDKPNLIFIMPDQLRADFLGCYGADFLETPHIDRLAETGSYTNTRCPPTRFAFPPGAAC